MLLQLQKVRVLLTPGYIKPIAFPKRAQIVDFMIGFENNIGIETDIYYLANPNETEFLSSEFILLEEDKPFETGPRKLTDYGIKHKGGPKYTLIGFDLIANL